MSKIKNKGEEMSLSRRNFLKKLIK